MTKYLLIAAFMATWVSGFSQTLNKPVYDEALAKKLGADQYGMKTYVMAFLKAGPNHLQDSTARLKLQMAHLKNIQRLAAEGKLVVAGPFLDDQPIKGIFIFNVATIDEARKLTETDPAIKAGSLIMELHPWYGSAALMQVLDTHSRIQRKVLPINYPDMERYDKRVDEYIEKAADFAKPILIHFRDLMHKASPLVTETIKWGTPHFEYKGTICTLAAFKQHCAIGFWKSSLLPDPHAVLTKREEAAGQFGKITSLDDLPSEEILLELIKSAIVLNEQGIKTEKKAPKPKIELTVPDDFKQLLAQNLVAQNNFENFSYSCKKEFLEWFEEAKTSSTRQKRLDSAMQFIADGKTRYWKYNK